MSMSLNVIKLLPDQSKKEAMMLFFFFNLSCAIIIYEKPGFYSLKKMHWIIRELSFPL